MTNRCPICEWPMAKSAHEGCVPGNCSYRPEHGTPEWNRVQRNRQALAEQAKGNLVFRDEAGKPVAVLDTSNL